MRNDKFKTRMVEAYQRADTKDKIFETLWESSNIDQHVISTYIRYKPEKVVKPQYGCIGVGYEGYAMARKE